MKSMLLIIGLYLGTVLHAQEVNFVLQVKQNGKTVSANKGVFTLENVPFSLQIDTRNLEGFLLGVTFDEDVYRSALGEADLEVSWFSETGMAEEMFNPDKSIFVSNDAPSYWFYNSAEEHRFDPKPKGTATDWVGERTIAQFDDLLNEKVIQVFDFRKSVYLFVYQPVYDDEYNLIDKKKLFHGELKFKEK